MAEASKRLPEATPGWSRTLSLLNPLRGAWWLFTNVRFAIFLLAVLSAVSLVGVLLPQKPLPVRGDVVAETDWLAVQEGRFGFLTGPLDALELFNLFHAGWFAVLLVITVVSTAAYLVSRLPGVWRGITQPRVRVPDRYFEMAPNRATAAAAIDVARIESMLRAARYGVGRSDEDGATYLFADRFQWAALGTLFTHAAIIIFILSAVVSRADSFSSPLFLAEGSTLPVFPVSNPDQIQVELLDSIARFSPDGIPLDYRSEMVIYRRGDEVKRCESTVNSPCSYDGYRLYQTAYFGFGAAVQVTDTATGNVIYRETLPLSERTDAPHLRIADSDANLLFDQPVVMTDAARAGEQAYSAALLALSNGRVITVWLPLDGDDTLLVFEPEANADGATATLTLGETADSAGLTFTYASLESVPSLVPPDFPLPERAGEGVTGEAFLQMSNVVYGTGTTSEGTTLDTAGSPAGAPPVLTMIGLREGAVQLAPGESAEIDGLEYRFLGQREFSGINVRRDRSDLLVWTGAALIVAGLVITFWVPRRRLWAKITPTRTWLAGQAPGHANYSRELQRLLDAAGANNPETT